MITETYIIRCPKCGTRRIFGTKDKNPITCYQCGNRFNFDETIVESKVKEGKKNANFQRRIR